MGVHQHTSYSSYAIYGSGENEGETVQEGNEASRL